MTQDSRISWTILEDPAALARCAAERLVAAAAAAVLARGRFMVALSGGSTPERTYRLLAEPEFVSRLDWGRTHLFFGDERWVPPDDPRSNYRLAWHSLLSHVPIPPEHVYPVETDRASPRAAAEAYARTLAAAFGVPCDGPPPCFDLLLLGLGDDGHTASLFPGQPPLTERRAWVTSSRPGSLPPPVDRITLTFPTLNAAHRVLFLVSGLAKAERLAQIARGELEPQVVPAVGVRPTHGHLDWLVDAAAASRITQDNPDDV